MTTEAPDIVKLEDGDACHDQNAKGSNMDETDPKVLPEAIDADGKDFNTNPKTDGIDVKSDKVTGDVKDKEGKNSDTDSKTEAADIKPVADAGGVEDKDGKSSDMDKPDNDADSKEATGRIQEGWEEADIARTGLNIPSFHVFLKVNGVPVSSPSKDSAEALKRPVRESMEHTFSGSRADFGYSYLNLSHKAFGMGTHDTKLRSTEIAMRHVSDFKVVSHTKSEEVLPLLQTFNKDAKEYPGDGVSVITFKASCVDHNGDVTLMPRGDKGAIVAPQLNVLKSELKKASKDTPVCFEMLVLPVNKQHVSQLPVLEDLVNYLIPYEIANDPLEHFFNVNQQTLKQRTMPASLVPYAGKENFPDMGIQRRRVRYTDSSERVMFLLSGAASEFAAEEYHTKTLGDGPFKAAILPFPHYEGPASCIMVVMPEERGGMLPQNGDSCLVRLPSRKRPQESDDSKKPMSSSETREVANSIATGVMAVLKKLRDQFDDVHGEVEGIGAAVSRYFTVTLDSKDVAMLRQNDDENQADHFNRVLQYCHDNSEILNSHSLEDNSQRRVDEPQDGEKPAFPSYGGDVDDPALGEGTQEPQQDAGDTGMAIWCHAQRMDDPTLCKQGWQSYIVKASREMRDNDHEFVTLPGSKDERPSEYLDRLLQDGNLQQAIFGKHISDTPLDRMFQAVNTLTYPASAPDDSPVSKRSENAFEYLLRFEHKDLVNLFEEIDTLKKVRDRESPSWLLDVFDNMDSSKRDAFARLSSVPDYIKFIAGVAACGKSTFLENLILGLFFGASDPASTPETSEPSAKKVLLTVGTNAAVDTFARNFPKRGQKLGLGSNAPRVLRLYAMDREVDQFARDHHDDNKGPNFDVDGARAVVESQEFSELDRFFATAAIRIQAAKSTRLHEKFPCRGMTLHEAAYDYFDERRSEFQALNDLLRKRALGGEEFTREDRTDLKAATKTLYRVFLDQFSGIICSTPIASSNHMFRTSFKPDLVLIDEAGRMNELELLVMVAFYSGPWIAVGDKAQLAPFTRTDHTAKNPDLSNNPFVRQIKCSTLERAVDAGVTDAYLTFNYRARGTLAKLPSELIYHGEMQTPSTVPRWPPSVKAFNNFLKTIHAEQPGRENRLLVHLPGSWLRTSTTKSSFNGAHVKWALDIVKRALQQDELTSTDGSEKCSVLVMAYYRAQVEKYEACFYELVQNGHVSRDNVSCVRFSTLDAAQGAQADLCIVDLVQTDGIGFTGDKRRQCLTITRSIQAEIVIAGPGMFVGMERRPSQEDRAAILRDLFHLMQDSNAVASIPTCGKCETPNPDHNVADCKETDKDVTYIECRASKSCMDNEHNWKDCPDIKCRGCHYIGKHRTSECTKLIPCFKCGGSDHNPNACTVEQRCSICREFDHWAFQCQNACRFCAGVDHPTETCPFQICKKCLGSGHVARDCMKGLECHICSGEGHIAKDCPDKPEVDQKCHHCKETGHKKKDCPTHKPACRSCGSLDHLRKECPKSHGGWKQNKDSKYTLGTKAYEKAVGINAILSGGNADGEDAGDVFGGAHLDTDPWPAKSHNESAVPDNEHPAVSDHTVDLQSGNVVEETATPDHEHHAVPGRTDDLQSGNNVEETATGDHGQHEGSSSLESAKTGDGGSTTPEYSAPGHSPVAQDDDQSSQLAPPPEDNKDGWGAPRQTEW